MSRGQSDDGVYSFLARDVRSGREGILFSIQSFEERDENAMCAQMADHLSHARAPAERAPSQWQCARGRIYTTIHVLTTTLAITLAASTLTTAALTTSTLTTSTLSAATLSTTPVATASGSESRTWQSQRHSKKKRQV